MPELFEMKTRVTRGGENHEILMREVSYTVILPAEERIQQSFDESDTKEEFVMKVKEEGLI